MPNTRNGQALIFDLRDGQHVGTLNDPTPTSGDSFGSSVDILGNHILVGAPRHDGQGTSFVGQAHLFDLATGDLLFTLDDPTPTDSDTFGVSVAIGSDHLLIGASDDDTIRLNSGQVHVFSRANQALLATIDAPSPTSNGEFGTSVAIDGLSLIHI